MTRMEKPKEVCITADMTVCYERIVNDLFNSIDVWEDYHFDNREDLLAVAKQLDNKLRR